MPLKDFQQSLFKNSKSVGAVWHKADLHVHAPRSSDYQYKAGDAVQQLGLALNAGGYSFAIVVQHEDFPSRTTLGEIQQHCPNTTLIPGAEVNVIVDALSKKITKDYYFHCVIAVDPNQSGEYSYVLKKAQEQFAYRKADSLNGFTSSVSDVGKFFQKNGALFFPAHLHQSKAPDVSRSVDDLYDDAAFLQFIADGAFSALEVANPRTAEFFEGGRRTDEGLVIPPITCVRSSDAHHHLHIAERNRATWIQAEKRNFSELVAALSFKHRVMLQEPRHKYARVIGLHIRGAFFPDEWLLLNDSINAFIGCKGSGKTAVLECLRFVLGTQVPRDRVDAVKAHLAHILGPAGYVECLVEKADDSQALLVRRADSPDRITVTYGNGETGNVGNSDTVGFTASILGWHEIEAVADRAQARVDLVDRIHIGNEVTAQHEAIRSNVERARDQLPILQRVARNLDNSLKALWELQRKREALRRLDEGDLLRLQRRYEWYLFLSRN